ncbi:uncharacterized protein NPIL_61341 [Nephila pilipes]|uniref:Sperm microtubule inner protein 1 C-terminal domain-containing protein n=1 Tax=Nephila pilipes TaxID=299642 RepID=A0A8X6NLG9_NEPPI|nr:uncharacterized protein NPIL_61341 [Nephila pilipes]
MAREKVLDPAFQKAFTESINKEHMIRINWHLKHDSGLKRTAEESCRWDDVPDDDDEDFVPPFDSTPPPPPEILKEGTLKPDVVGQPHIYELKDLKKIEDEMKVMKPVHPKTKKLLYEGISKEDEGKIKYLKVRKKKKPEDKYYFPVCTSWEYGWTYGQEPDLSFPEHGRKQAMKPSFFRPNDVQLKPRDRID